MRVLSNTCQLHLPTTGTSTSYGGLMAFDAWGLDVVGPITPKSSAGHIYILAATDYFSKWAEAVPLKEVKKETVVDFIRVNIIFRYGATTNGLAEAFNKTLCNLLKKVGQSQRRTGMRR
ncbi:UNVERIFIED_CONTAM: hypothetical protein Sradi_3341200 [Sesamum radiatum]|uniref:Integrase catalytic domain-containing protein n=1 Tax=Sesamum radiatum TaxID=300843 RepID=A0AAW2R2A3_SESRA